MRGEMAPILDRHAAVRALTTAAEAAPDAYPLYHLRHEILHHETRRRVIRAAVTVTAPAMGGGPGRRTAAFARARSMRPAGGAVTKLRSCTGGREKALGHLSSISSRSQLLLRLISLLHLGIKSLRIVPESQSASTRGAGPTGSSRRRSARSWCHAPHCGMRQRGSGRRAARRPTTSARGREEARGAGCGSS